MQWENSNTIRSAELFGRSNFPPLQDNELHVWSVSLEAEQEFIERCTSVLSDGEKKRIDWFSFPQVQNNYIISQGVLRTLLAGYLNIEPSQVQLSKQAKGKPFVTNDTSLFFNLSNSGKKAVFAFLEPTFLPLVPNYFCTKLFPNQSKAKTGAPKAQDRPNFTGCTRNVSRTSANNPRAPIGMACSPIR